MAALAARVATAQGSCTLLPLAIEYPFWDERLPETLLYLAEPLKVEAGDGVEQIQMRALNSLQEAMTEMEQLALSRSADGFELLQGGRLGTGGFYAFGQRLKAFLMRRPYVAEHSPMPKLQTGSTK